MSQYFHIIKRLNFGAMRQINDKLDSRDFKENNMKNELRQRLFEERVRNGFYGDRNNQEVESLKKEVSGLKDSVDQLTKLLAQKLT